MNSTTANTTIFFKDYETYTAKFKTGMQQLWDMYPEKQAWMSNKNFKTQPTTDEFT